MSKITIDRATVEQALEAMSYADACLKKHLTTKTKHEHAQDMLLSAGSALRQALEQEKQQEPVKVGRIAGNVDGILRQEVMLYTDNYLPIGTAIYTSPPASKPWVGLTDEEIDAKTDFRATVRYFEAKLKEKNT